MLTAAALLLLLAPAAELLYRDWLSRQSEGAIEDPGAFHIYVVGGSSAVGVPYHLSAAEIASRMFNRTVGNRPIVIHMLARASESLYPQSVRVVRALHGRDAARPGALLIYAGHNERINRHLAPDPGAWTRIERMVTGQSRVAMELVRLLRQSIGRAPQYSIETSEYHLRRIIEQALGAGLTPILATVPGNLCDIEPNFLVPDLDRFRQALAAAEPLEADGNCSALAGQRAATALGGSGLDAYLSFRTATCLRKLGRMDRALPLFQAAVDQDPRTNFGRATSEQNALLRTLAGEYAIPLVDSVADFAAASPGGCTGNHLFADGHHPNLAGHVLLAEGLAQALSSHFGEPIRRHFQEPETLLAALPPESRASPHLLSGGWLLATSCFHPMPAGRMALAEWHYLQALAHQPHSFTAWTGLALARAARDGRLLNRPEVVDQLGQWQIFYSGRFQLPPEGLDSLARWLDESGIDSNLMGEIRRSWAAEGRDPASPTLDHGGQVPPRR